MIIDLEEIRQAKLVRSPGNDGPEICTLRGKIEMLEVEIAGLQMVATGLRADFERECRRVNEIMAALLGITADKLDDQAGAPPCVYRG
jgi:hypothetical protein